MFDDVVVPIRRDYGKAEVERDDIVADHGHDDGLVHNRQWTMHDWEAVDRALAAQ